MEALVIENLSKIYGNGFVALRGISLTVQEGDFFALLGPNGAGKSTTIGIISSLVNKTSGRVCVFGDELDSNPGGVKSHIGLVPQEFNFNQFERVHEIVANQAGYYGIARKLARERTEEVLRRLDLWEKRNETSRNLSGGMKRRLMIARALVHHPRLLILDEPTAGVDIEIRRSMWEFLRHINREGTTIILTTHYLEEAESLCRNIAIIDEGEIIEHSTMKGLLAKLHMETFILDLSRSICEPPDLKGYRVRLMDESTLEVDIEKREGMNKLFEQLARQGLDVLSMRNKSNRLEQLFMNLVEANDTDD